MMVHFILCSNSVKALFHGTFYLHCLQGNLEQNRGSAHQVQSESKQQLRCTLINRPVLGWLALFQGFAKVNPFPGLRGAVLLPSPFSVRAG